MSNNIYNLTLKNGLKLIYQQIDNTNIAAVNIFVGVGSMYEDKKNNGITHFLEHLIFKGSKSYINANSIAKVFDTYGATVNAFTDKDVTCFWYKSDYRYMDECFKVLSDIVVNTLLNDYNSFVKEKQVVIEELNLSLDNNANFVLDKVIEQLYYGTTLARPIGGNEHTVSNLDFKDIKSFYKKYYKSNNIVVSIASKLSFNTVKKMVQHSVLNSALSDSTLIERPINNVLVPQDEIRIKMHYRKLEQTNIAIGFRTCNMYNDDVYVLDIIDNLLAGNMTSILFDALRNKHGLTYGVSTEVDNYYTTGSFIILTSVLKEKLITNGTKPGLIKVIIKSLNSLIKNGITESQLKYIQKNISGNKTLEFEDINNITIYNGLTIMHNYPKFISFNDLYKKYNSITVSQVNSVIRKYFKPKHMSVYILGESEFIDMKEISKECNKLKNDF